MINWSDIKKRERERVWKFCASTNTVSTIWGCWLRSIERNFLHLSCCVLCTNNIRSRQYQIFFFRFRNLISRAKSWNVERARRASKSRSKWTPKQNWYFPITPDSASLISPPPIRQNKSSSYKCFRKTTALSDVLVLIDPAFNSTRYLFSVKALDMLWDIRYPLCERTWKNREKVVNQMELTWKLF